ncbi:MAG: hypothetical protein HY986_02455 [Candidatus Melainabacteria bacterium]|nr:hypothetical protein [Candidatus Melainabacteria bacterium]
MSIIPKSLKSGFLGGISSETAEEVFGKLYPLPPGNQTRPEPKDSCESVRKAARKCLQELRSVYGRDGLTHQPYCYGIMAGIDYLCNVLSLYPFQHGITISRNVLAERLSAVDRIEAGFGSHSVYDPECRLFDQEQNPISDEEAYVWGCREGLKYALSLCTNLSETQSGSLSGYLELDPVMRSFGFAAQEQKHFVQKVLPQLQTKYEDRPSFYAVDMLCHGWSAASRFLKACNLSEAKDCDCSQEANRQLLFSFVEALRAAPMMFHTFKLGFGHSELRPASTNRVFQIETAVKDVPVEDILQLTALHYQAGKRSSAKTWLM